MLSFQVKAASHLFWINLLLLSLSKVNAKLINKEKENVRYEATWESLDARPLPTWYDEAKVGIFIHWGVFSVPSFENEWFWWRWAHDQDTNYEAFVNATETTKRFNYPDYAHRFDATLYHPDEWAKVFAQSGAQYVVLTSKHHEGFCMWDSKQAVPTTWNWNVMDIGPRRDLLGDLAKAIRQPDIRSAQTNQPLKFGVYHSLFEWFNPMLHQDEQNNFETQTFVHTKTMPELYHLVETYEPEVIWSDGEAGAHSDYWDSKKFLAWLATNSSVKDTVVWNDRWGNDTSCRHGSFFNCADRYMPHEKTTFKFENAMTLDKGSWGYNRVATVQDYLSTQELLEELVQTVSRNGNLLVNVGPAADGTISPIMVDRLLEMGKWLSVNGQGIYKTTPWKVCSEEELGDKKVYYTRSNDTLYAHLTEWPAESVVTLHCPHRTRYTKARMLGLKETAQHPVTILLSAANHDDDPTVRIGLPPLTPNVIPCQHVWVLALTGIGNLDNDDDDFGGEKFRTEPRKT